jgi:4-methylaminobutanoate oxidase (formaldehyde-forming)
MGPTSRALLSTLTTADLRDEAFVATSRSIPLGRATVRATRITYVGELGWELYVLRNSLWRVRRPDECRCGIRCGTRWLLCDRIATAGEGLPGVRPRTDPGENPVEAGLLFARKLGTDIGFLGRDAVERARATGVRRRLVGFAVSSPEPMLWGGELILRDGAPCGQVTSAAWGETTGACVGLAYVRAPAAITADWIRMGTYDVNVGGRQYPIEYRCGLTIPPTPASVPDRRPTHGEGAWWFADTPVRADFCTFAGVDPSAE